MLQERRDVALNSVRHSGISLVGNLDELLELDLIRNVEGSDFGPVEDLVFEEVGTWSIGRSVN